MPANSQKINSLTSLYVQSEEQILMTMLFIHLDQNHDFHVESRGSLPYTSSKNIYKDYEHTIIANINSSENNSFTLNNPFNNLWLQSSIRTSFYGGESVYGILYMNENTFNYLKIEPDYKKEDDNGIDLEKIMNMLKCFK